jgi:hypothetical protein
MEAFRTTEQAIYSLGASFNYLSASATVAIHSQSYNSRSNFVVDFSQRYYSASINPPEFSSSVFSDVVNLEEVKRVTSGENPPLYISDIAYGRRVILLFSSTETADSLRAAISSSVSGLVASGHLDASSDTSRVFSKTDLRGLVLGGSAGGAIGLVTGDGISAALKTHLKTGAESGWKTSGSPISFRANYLDNTIAALQYLGVDQSVQPAIGTHWFLRWSNHYEPGVIYKVVRNMDDNSVGGASNRNYLPFVEKLLAYPGREPRSEVEVAGDEMFKAQPNYWSSPPYNCPTLTQDGLHVMDNEKWYLVSYVDDTPKPGQ